MDKHYINLIHKAINECSASHTKGKKCNLCSEGYIILNEFYYHTKNGKSISETLYILQIKNIDLISYINKYGIH